MLVTAAAVRMDSARGHGPSPFPSSASPPPPAAWLPAADHNHNHHRRLPHGSPPSAAAAPSHRPRTPPAARRVVAKRRPRPSRRQPTTYISADAASFRRMVHQVTGADDLPLPLPLVAPPPADHQSLALCRPAPAPGVLVLPTLDTSAFLLGGGSATAARAPAPRDCSGPPGLALDQVVDAVGFDAAAAGGPCSNGSGCGGGFPTLESWDALLY